MLIRLDPLTQTKGGRYRKPAEKHKSSKAKSSSGSPPVSFLFVVNKLVFYEGDSCDFNRDVWHNTLPPRNCLGYQGEYPSNVMRYEGGQVTEARGYQWYRHMLHAEGFCFDPTLSSVPCYSRAAVFSCNPHLPVVVIPADPTTLPDQEQTMHALHFCHPPPGALRGLSQATTPDGNNMPAGGGPRKYVAGRSPTWMPALVPQTYANPRGAAAPPSRGLGGELPIVLGLMAFSGAPDQVYVSRSDSGHRGFWRDGVWTHNHAPALCTSPPCVCVSLGSPASEPAIGIWDPLTLALVTAPRSVPREHPARLLRRRLLRPGEPGRLNARAHLQLRVGRSRGPRVSGGGVLVLLRRCFLVAAVNGPHGSPSSRHSPLSLFTIFLATSVCPAGQLPPLRLSRALRDGGTADWAALPGRQRAPILHPGPHT